MEDLASAAELVRGRPQMEVISGLLEEKGQPWRLRVPWSHQDEATSVTADEWQQSWDQTDWRERVNAGEAVPVDTETVASHCIQVREERHPLRQMVIGR